MHFGHNLTKSHNIYIFYFSVTYFYEKEAKNMTGLNHWLLLTFFSKLDYGIYIDLYMRSNIVMTILKYGKL